MECGGFCELLVDSIRSLLISLNAIKRTQVLTEEKDKIQQYTPYQ